MSHRRTSQRYSSRNRHFATTSREDETTDCALSGTLSANAASSFSSPDGNSSPPLEIADVAGNGADVPEDFPIAPLDDGSFHGGDIPSSSSGGARDHSDDDECDAPSDDSDVGDPAECFDDLTTWTEAEHHSTNAPTRMLPRPAIDLDSTEEGMLELMRLCDSSGARRGLYDDLVTLLRRRSKEGFNVSRAYSRELFVAKLSSQIPLTRPIKSAVRGHTVFRFPFVDMLQDLFDSSAFDCIDNLCANRDEDNRFNKFVPTPGTMDDMENISREWSSDTFDSLQDFTPGEDLFVPLILYADKTGTDTFQRYPLEPWMFTTPILRRHVREDSDMWRHLGFIPPVSDDEAEQRDRDNDHSDPGAVTDDESHNKGEGASSVNLQLYHDFLYSILSGVRQCQADKPKVRANLGGVKKTVRVHVHIAMVMGDQLANDCNSGRVSNNNSSAGRLHRACMCSGVRGSDAVNQSCSELVDHHLLSDLNDIALLNPDEMLRRAQEVVPAVNARQRKERKLVTDFLSTKIKLARAIMAKPYTQHVLRNGFRGLSFGANSHGVHGATMDDHLHSFDAGVVLYNNDVFYSSFTESEGKKFDQILRQLQAGSRSSVATGYPFVKIKKNFNSQSLMAHHERVGSLFNALLGLHTADGTALFENAQKRQQNKYDSFPDVEGGGTSDEDGPSDDSSSDSGEEEDESSDASSSECGSSDEEKSDSSDDSSSENEFIESEERLASSTQDELRNERKEKKRKRLLVLRKVPHRHDALFFADNNESEEFDRSDDTVKFIVDQLRRYGFSSLLQQGNLDELQVEQLMNSSWKLLKGHRNNQSQFPSPATIQSISDVSLSRHLSEANISPPSAASALEMNCLQKLRKTNLTTQKSIAYHHSFRIKGCEEKHRRKRQKVKGAGYTGAVLCPTEQYRYFIEYLLLYHSFCHYGYKLREDLRNNIDLIDYGCRLVVRYFDTFLYRGDGTIDSDFCKLHSQLHLSRSHRLFGDVMQYNCNTGERGLKKWAMKASQTARKVSVDTFHSDTASRIWEQLLYRQAWDDMQRKKLSDLNVETELQHDQQLRLRRRHCHFIYKRNLQGWTLTGVDRFGKRIESLSQSAVIKSSILKALITLEPNQRRFHLWCEAKLPNGDNAKCWPMYRQDTGPYYDWVLVHFSLDGDDRDNLHPAKLLAFYTDSNGSLKALVHSVDDKLTTRSEGPFGDTQLVTHYRRQFRKVGNRVIKGEAEVYSVKASDIRRTILAYEAKPSMSDPLPPQIRYKDRHDYTVAVIRPRDEWPELFLTLHCIMHERRNVKRVQLLPLN